MTSIRLVTISATYGAGGSVVAPALASRLGVPFVDRLVVPSAVHQLSEGLSEDEREAGWLPRLIAAAARLPPVIGVSLPPPPDGLTEEERFRVENERLVCHLLESGGGVVLGRGAAAFLGRAPGCFHVRLDGPRDARVAQAARIEKISEDEARRRQAETDRTRALYVRRFYDRDNAGPALYHLLMDSTTVPLDGCVDLIAAAVALVP
ncbi:MAG TPA: cytidylate kinase-like family protein [Acidimicrobiales bacterium]|jgi:cytidylate kinase|nr:cytidylate kinase-like family protein [Acidimicrobiales bacterium]